MGEIVLFSKGRCPHCTEAKALLSELAIPFRDIDIEADVSKSMLMSLVSNRHTVPQIFFNDEHIGGADELKRLDSDAIKSRARQALGAASPPAFLTTDFSREQLEAAIIPLKDVLDPHLPQDPTALPEYAAVRIWYSTMFGFLCNLYDQMSLRPEPMALFIGALSSMMSLVSKHVGLDFGISCFSTAFAANCSYCSAHGADLGMKYAGKTPEHIKDLYDFLQQRKPLDELPFDDKLKAIINLSARMTTQSIAREDIEHARAAFGADELREAIYSVGGMGSLMGFLNRFNDLIGVEIEASIKQNIDNSALAAEWDWGTHDTADELNRYDYRDQQPPAQGPPTLEQFRELTARVLDEVFAELQPMYAKYGAFDPRLMPDWIGTYPEAHAITSVGALYQAAFNAGVLDAETKHLAAYVLALGANQPQMAADEREIAARVSDDADKLAAKLEELEAFATTGRLPGNTVLTSAEIVAMKLARVSQTFPHVVRGELVVELAEALTPEQIVELVIALAVAGMGQRWININSAYAAHAPGSEV
jgi:glutaredoxin 3